MALSLVSISPALIGCSVFENGDINDYVGEYELSISYERKKHYYWGNTTLISETTPVTLGSILTIHSNKKAELQYPNDGAVIKGKIKVYKEYVKFINLPFSSSYKFKKNDDKSLDYSYVEEKHTLDYDFTTRRLYFQYLASVED